METTYELQKSESQFSADGDSTFYRFAIEKAKGDSNDRQLSLWNFNFSEPKLMVTNPDVFPMMSDSQFLVADILKENL